MRNGHLVSGAFVVLVLVGNSLAQSGGPYEIKKSVIASGRGVSNGGPYSVDSTIGEPVAGTESAGANYSLIAGYRAGGAAADMLTAVYDFDGNGKTDQGIFRPADSLWITFGSTSQQAAFTVFGAPTDTPIPSIPSVN